MYDNDQYPVPCTAISTQCVIDHVNEGFGISSYMEVKQCNGSDSYSAELMRSKRDPRSHEFKQQNQRNTLDLE